jgi:hypothetical protein
MFVARKADDDVCRAEKPQAKEWQAIARPVRALYQSRRGT